MRAKLLLHFSIILICCVPLISWAQQGGSSTYDFLTIPNSAKIAALGGNQVGYFDHDLNQTFHNPAILTDSMNQQLVLNYVPYMAGIKYGYVAYAFKIQDIGAIEVGMQNINYGSMTRTDEYDNTLGTFSAAEYALLLSYSRSLTPTLRAGITIKPVYSHLDQYNSSALAADAGIIYHSHNGLTSAGITFKNFGSQITAYESTSENLPTDLQIGFTTKLAHAPFKISITMEGLLNWDLDYTIDNSLNDSSYATDEDNTKNIGENLLNHTIVGIEFTPTNNFFIAGGYNFRRRSELKLADKTSTVGMSWGVGFRIYKFRFAYASARYHLSGTTNHFSLTANLNDFKHY